MKIQILDLSKIMHLGSKTEFTVPAFILCVLMSIPNKLIYTQIQVWSDFIGQIEAVLHGTVEVNCL